MSFLERIQTCNQICPDQYRSFEIEGTRYGWIRHEFTTTLREWPEVFNVNEKIVSLTSNLKTYRERTTAVQKIIEALHARGDIDTWVGERYPVTNNFDQRPIMEMERSGVLYFGLLGFGIHMNGLVKTSDGIYVWVATRAKDKPFYSGRLDQMVAGGQPLGISIHQNLIKECAEEANILEEVAVKAQARGRLNYSMDTHRGIDVSTIFIYDLWLPEDFEPENTDGEVDNFMLIPLQELARLSDETELFKDNCNLVNIDLLIRSGLITAEYKDFDEIIRLLYAPHRQNLMV